MLLGNRSIRLCASLLGSGWVLTVLGAGPSFIVAMEDADNRPFEYVDETGRVTGFHSELVRAVAARLGWQLQFLRVPWNRAQYMLESGQVDAVTYMGITQERKKYALFLDGNKLHVEHVTLFIRKTDLGKIRYQPPVAEMMKRWHFGAPQGYFLGKEIDDAVKAGIQVDLSAHNQVQLFSMLIAKRLDVVAAEVVALQLVKPSLPDVDMQVQALAGARFSGNPMYIAFPLTGNGPAKAKQFSDEYAKWRQSEEYPGQVVRFRVSDRIPDEFALH
jgi:polar amino acid transport system substrate-binding protein